MKLFSLTVLVCLAGLLCVSASVAETALDSHLRAALALVGQDEQSLIVPGLQRPAWRAGRLAVVDQALADPLSMQRFSRQALDLSPGHSMAAYLSGLLELGGILASESTDFLKSSSAPTGTGAGRNCSDPRQTIDDSVQAILRAIERAGLNHRSGGGSPTTDDMLRIHAYLEKSLNDSGSKPQPHWMTRAVLHEVGARVDRQALATGLLELLATVEAVLPDLGRCRHAARQMDKTVSDRRVRVAGLDDDRHSGDYLLLIDLGGNDRYENVGPSPAYAAVSVIIDLDGDDEVLWDSVPGPGSGVLGTGLWIDMAGDDSYRGGNYGSGSALLGAGLHWDMRGNDSYSGNANVQGAGHYGIGILLDSRGDDSYLAFLSSQGFAGAGGTGYQIDVAGNDRYQCKGRFPDTFEKRVARSDEKHYVNMCQGFSFGVKPRASGGIGMLLDRAGDDEYRADLFAQGAALWFGLGVLTDGDGDDSYHAYEHAQGDGLHFAAGFLGDWAGADDYSGYEHCQGVGKDRSTGFLYDHAGDDRYASRRHSQGVGIKPFASGLFVDRTGDDRYTSKSFSQGYSTQADAGQPDRGRPIGVFMDLAGKDQVDQPGVKPPDAVGRISSPGGVAIDRDAVEMP